MYFFLNQFAILEFSFHALVVATVCRANPMQAFWCPRTTFVKKVHARNLNAFKLVYYSVTCFIK